MMAKHLAEPRLPKHVGLSKRDYWDLIEALAVNRFELGWNGYQGLLATAKRMRVEPFPRGLRAVQREQAEAGE